jgi:hypothetical protein
VHAQKEEVNAMLHRLLPMLALLSLPVIAWAQSPLDDLTEADLANRCRLPKYD